MTRCSSAPAAAVTVLWARASSTARLRSSGSAAIRGGTSKTTELNKRALTRGARREAGLIFSPSGNLIGRKKGIVNDWTECFSERLQEEPKHQVLRAVRFREEILAL